MLPDTDTTFQICIYLGWALCTFSSHVFVVKMNSARRSPPSLWLTRRSVTAMVVNIVRFQGEVAQRSVGQLEALLNLFIATVHGLASKVCVCVHACSSALVWCYVVPPPKYKPPRTLKFDQSTEPPQRNSDRHRISGATYKKSQFFFGFRDSLRSNF